MMDVNQAIKLLLEKFIELQQKEQFPLYNELYTKYYEALNMLHNNAKIEPIRDKLKFTIRAFQEAPPKDKKISVEILQLMDRIHKVLFN